MTIMRIESLVFGVLDLEACVRFFKDAGLDEVEAGAAGATLRTPEGQTVCLRMADDPALPPPVAAAPTLREVVWGVDSSQALAAIGSELEKDRSVSTDASGTLHSRDHTGFGIGFAPTAPVRTEPETPRKYNVLRNVNRWNEPVTAYERVRPIRLLHVTLDIPKEGREAAIDFYVSRLRFRLIDQVLDTGSFMQCEGDVEHHNLFLCFRPDKAGFNHVAMEARDFDEVMEGGNYMIEHGWQESRVAGRHKLGSNFYRFFHCPAGGRIELAADMDRMDKSFKTRVWQKNPGHHVWSLKS
jgi:catechol 2,3-dioxygenase-like lactoylglutathione lyase family enzyme